MARILIVEDNEMNRDMLSRRLMRKNHNCTMAVDGQDALESVKADAPDLILMDVNMPVMDGYEATKVLKADPAVSHIPIIALTAHALADDREKALEVGCDDYHSKPVDFPALLAQIEKLTA